jgi:hypothetical protein
VLAIQVEVSFKPSVNLSLLESKKNLLQTRPKIIVVNENARFAQPAGVSAK